MHDDDKCVNGDVHGRKATSKAIATFITYPLVRSKVLAKTPGDTFKARTVSYVSTSFRGITGNRKGDEGEEWEGRG